MESSNKNILNNISTEATDIIKRISGNNYRKDYKVIDNIISFMGASGGCGTSTIMANVTAKISDKGLSVLIIDMNIEYPSQHNFWGLQQDSRKKDLIDFLTGRANLGDSIENLDKLSVMYPINRTLVDIISIDSNTCSKNLEEGLKRARKLFDIVLMDMSKEYMNNDTINTALYESNNAYIICDENITYLNNTDKIIRNMATTGIGVKDRLYSILNKDTGLHNESMLEKLGVKNIGVLPFDKNIIQSGQKGEIFIKKGASFSKQSALFCTKISEITDSILGNAGLIEVK